MRLAATVSLVLMLTACTRGDEAILPTGKRLDGTLILEQGRLVFRAKSVDLPAGKLVHVLVDGAVSPFSSARPLTVHFHHDERLSGRLFACDNDVVKLQTAWADALNIPRRFVEAITHAGSQAVLQHIDFETDTKHVQLKGARRSEEARSSGQLGLKLDAAQEAVWTLPAPLEAGRISFWFRLPDPPGAASASVQADFGRPEEALTIELAGPDKHYRVETKLPGDNNQLERTAGWHHLELRVAADYFLIGCDDRLLWSSGDKVRLPQLRSLRFACTKGKPLFLDDLNVARPIPPAPRPPGDLQRDEAWLFGGDQLFGKAGKIDADGVAFDLGKRSLQLGWNELRGVYFPPDAQALAPTSTGAHARITLRSGIDGAADQLIGVVVGLDDKLLKLRHPLLGELKIEKKRIARVDPLVQGRRVEVAPGQNWKLDTPAAGQLFIAPRGSSARPVLATDWPGTLQVNGRKLANPQFTNATPSLRRELPVAFLRKGVNRFDVLPTKEGQQAIPFLIVVELPDRP
ncbi:MAG: hypothetical protein AB7K24_01990 [Gemmataceae bacterium]